MVVHNKSLLFKRCGITSCFCIVKGSCLLGPYFFLNFVSLEEYGVVEFSYALGSVLAVVAMLGLGGLILISCFVGGKGIKSRFYALWSSCTGDSRHSLFVALVRSDRSTIFANFAFYLDFCTPKALQLYPQIGRQGLAGCIVRRGILFHIDRSDFGHMEFRNHSSCYAP